MTNRIHVIATGGTIDSEYFPPRETSVPSKESIIAPYITGKIKPYADVTFETVFMLDSGDITDTHRAQIADSIRRSDAPRAIVCHGTNTMTATAAYLDTALAPHSKTIILTGSMIPLKEFAQSDAGFNLGFAISESLHLGAGIYICMNAEVFAAGSVRKNFDEGRFEPLTTK